MKRRTIRRRHQAGEFEHAFRDQEGSWRIPVDDLVASGLRPNVVTDPEEPRIVFSAASQVDRLRTEVAVLRERVRALEIIAKEREERVTDLRTILRMLPAAGVASEPPTETLDESSAGMVPERAADVVPEPAMQEEAPWPVEMEEVPDTIEVADAGAPVDEVVLEPFTEEEPVHAEMAPLDEPMPEPSPTGSPEAMEALEEPLLILPDTPTRDTEPSEEALEESEHVLEGARQRSAELLDDAMSLWWPSPARAPQVPGPTPLETGAARYGHSGSLGPVISRASDRPVTSPNVEPDPTPPPPAPTKSDLFGGEVLDETSFDWLDPNFGRPPRHLRRRLGRFFRRNRRPR